MANHGPAYGLSADIKAKIESKLDPGLQRQAIDYIKEKTGQQINDFHADLKDGTVIISTLPVILTSLLKGVILCNLVNTLRPGLIKKINTGKMPFLQMENINAFLTAIEAMGIAKIDSFMTVGTFNK